MSRSDWSAETSGASDLTVVGTPAFNWKELQAGRYLLQPERRRPWDVAVARVSTEEQVREGCSLEQQISLAKALAGRTGHEITAVYLDPGISAAKRGMEKRPGAQMLLQDIRQGRIRTIYVYKRDRVSRNTEEWIAFLSLCAGHGVTIIVTCPGEAPVGQGVYGRFQETIIIALAELEVGVTRMRVLDSTLERFRDGKYVGGKLPFGLCQDESRRIIPHPGEAPIVQLIFRLATEEMLGDVRIALRLNTEHPLSCRGHGWDRFAVQRVINNRTYCGYFHIRVESKGDGPPRCETLERRSDLLPVLVSEEEWELARRLRKARRHTRNATASRYRVANNSLSGLVVCGECGHVMRLHQTVQQYKCRNGDIHEYRHDYFKCVYGEGIVGCGNRGSASAVLIEEAVVRVCTEVLPSLDVRELLDRTREYADSRRRVLREALAEQEGELGLVEGRIQRNHDLLESAVSSAEIEHYQERLKSLICRRGEIQERITAIRTDHSQSQCTEQDVRHWTGLASQWPHRFGAATMPGRRKLLAQVLERVVWHPRTRLVDLIFQFGDMRSGSQKAVRSQAAFSITGVQIRTRQNQLAAVGRVNEQEGKNG